MPRRSAAAAEQTRESIVSHALEMGSLDGLESLSFGRVADEVELSKSGVIRHFATKEDLQLAALEAGRRLFVERIWLPAAEEPAGLPRLRAVMDGWLRYLASGPLPGGCLVTATAVEFDSKPGAVREAVREDSRRWLGTLERDIEVAVRAGELPPDTEPAQLAFELQGIALVVNQMSQLHGSKDAVQRGRDAVFRVLEMGRTMQG